MKFIQKRLIIKKELLKTFHQKTRLLFIVEHLMKLEKLLLRGKKGSFIKLVNEIDHKPQTKPFWNIINMFKNCVEKRISFANIYTDSV